MATNHSNIKKTGTAAGAVDLIGTTPALSTEQGKSGPPDIRDVSLRWFAGTVLTGVTSITLMGGALMAAVDGQNVSSIPAHALKQNIHTAKIDEPGALLTRKSDRPLPIVVEESENQILRLSTLTRGEDGDRVRSRPFARLNSSLVRRVGEPTYDIPSFDPVTIFSGSSNFREKGGEEVLYGSQVEDEIEIRTTTFPFNNQESQAFRGFSNDEIESIIRRQLPALQASLDDGTILARAGAIAYVDPARFEGSTPPPAEAPFDELVTIRSENVLTVNKTSQTARLQNAGRNKTVRPKKKLSMPKFWHEDMGMNNGADAIVSALSEELGISSVAPEHKLRMSYAGGPDSNIPDIVSVYDGEDHMATIARADDGSYVAIEEPQQIENKPEKKKPAPVAGKQTSTYTAIFQTALKNNIPMQLARELIRIYAFDVDFRSSIKSTDSMEVFYSLDPDQETATDESEILYTSLTLRDQKRRYYRFKTSDDGAVDYYDENGRSAKKFLMRQPVPRARFRSRFGWRRHPILRTTRLHKGVDWSASRGTPIFAAGNGVIEDAKWFSGYGRWIKIRHANGYKTGYAHMSRFAKGMKSGVRVRQGQIIGYVGSSGLSTGPHLHYEVIVNGRHVDPMRIRLPRGRVLSGEQLVAFERERYRIDQLLKGPDVPVEQDFALNK